MAVNGFFGAVQHRISATHYRCILIYDIRLLPLPRHPIEENVNENKLHTPFKEEDGAKGVWFN